ncbi:Protein YghO [Flavobacteriales bacterium]|nr:hypothetical protein [Flavobacteriales bacterium]MCL4817088.1 hypothetical protein [Flavobacteriales bacterium]WKZ76048.1 MAG: hypothetical protein QY303_03955 [Vicingaceae bacterium]GIK70485.1 MAG: hypothetical protein BroJett020_17800 [Bacteroidota bacterium]CAG0987565.1 Protein YghO [Flavobacteriales bacterium]
MSVEIREVKTKQDAKEFVEVVYKIYKGNKYWAPAMKSDEAKSLFPETNPAFEFCNARFWIAFKNGQCVGRIGAIVNHLHNQKTGEKTGRITRVEFMNDIEVLKLLINTAEAWLKEQGMSKVQGPLGFSNLDLQGMLVEGFEYLPSIASVYHQPYYHKLIEQLGYTKEIDWVEFRLTIGEAAVSKASRGAQLIAKRYGISVLHFKSTAELLPYSATIFSILNDSFDDLPFVTKFTEPMMDFYKEKYIKLLNPEFVKLVKMKEEVIGFVIGLPSLSKAMQKAKGSLFPFGFWHILKARSGKNNDTLDQMLTGVKKEHQATGAAVILMAELQNAMLQKGMKYIETTGIFETNASAIANWKNYENIQHKRKRCYRKDLL